jgi:alpha-D-ribose 1-methylphosphonate 5-phosphate C-P lyase
VGCTETAFFLPELLYIQIDYPTRSLHFDHVLSGKSDDGSAVSEQSYAQIASSLQTGEMRVDSTFCRTRHKYKNADVSEERILSYSDIVKGA